jgi:hypothetical protein
MSYDSGMTLVQLNAVTAERDALRAELELRRKSGSAVDRLHNLIEGIAADADGSEWSREEWERLDAENATLRAELATVKTELRTLKAHYWPAPTAQPVPPSKVYTDPAELVRDALAAPVETVPWPVVSRYIGGASADGVAGRVWLLLGDGPDEIEYVPVQAAPVIHNDSSGAEVIHNAAAPMSAEDAITESMVFMGARELCSITAEACNTNAEDEWMTYGEDFKSNVRRVLCAALASKGVAC